MRLFLIIIVLFCGCLFTCTPIPQSSSISGSSPKTLQLIDRTYEPGIKTVLLYPYSGDREDMLLPAVTQLGKWNLVLEFDDLKSDQETYYARVIHCNKDWTKSELLDLDFMTEFNEFPLNNFEFSTDTHIPYVHYRVRLPGVKLPGNYVLAVYRGSNRDDVVLTRRFMVYDRRITLARQESLVGPGRVADLNQQINFTLNYKNVEILNPMQDVSVAIRQNQRWDNMATELKPSFIREIERELEYRFFDPEKMFKGGNEFRFFDLRSINYPGRNVATVNREVTPFDVYIALDKSRAHEAYSQYDDLNGKYVISNLDFADQLTSNYVNVNFTLQSPPIQNGSVFIAGALSNWNYTNENKMVYNAEQGVYQGQLLLKQGWYDYQYYVQAPNVPPYQLEGSHFETENFYEVFVYFRPYQPRADLLIGYFRIVENER